MIFLLFFLLLQLVYFSDKTTQGLAADNSDLREQLERVRGQLVQTHNTTKTATVTAPMKDGNQGTSNKGEEGKKEGQEGDNSGDGGKIEVYKAQVKDLNKRLAQLQEVKYKYM